MWACTVLVLYSNYIPIPSAQYNNYCLPYVAIYTTFLLLTFSLCECSLGCLMDNQSPTLVEVLVTCGYAYVHIANSSCIVMLCQVVTRMYCALIEVTTNLTWLASWLAKSNAE